MYADFIADASFWRSLCAIDLELRQQAISKGCPLCGGPLHVADYPRKPRGVPDEVEEAFSSRYSTCCGHCRSRCTPPSVRFLGRRVYVGVIMMLATMRALVCGAADETLARWSAWWTEILPTMAMWAAMRAHFVPAVQVSRLPASLIERFEPSPDRCTEHALLDTLRALSPVTTQSAVRTLDDGGSLTVPRTQKMRIDEQRRGLLRGAQAPPKHS